MVTKAIIFLMFSLVLPVTVSEQDSIPQKTHERVFLITDRNLYATGEAVSFSAFIKSGFDDRHCSKVLYCELVTPEGKQVGAGKYSIENKLSSGSLSIPENLFTGIYFLRAYTRFMRNEGPSSFSYVQLRIINPERNEVQPYAVSGIPQESISVAWSEKNPDDLTIKAVKNRVFARDTVHIIFKQFNENKALRNLTVSVVPEGSFREESILMPSLPIAPEKELFYPESSGVTLTGAVREKETGRSVKGIRISLSILGEGKDFMSVRTDSTGHFYFSIPGYTGYREVFLSAEDTVGIAPVILIDNDFCPLPVKINTGDFKLTDEERKLAYKIAVNSRVVSYFKDSVASEVKHFPGDQAFYGTPEQVLYMDKYIQLPTLEEYFNGLPAWVKVRKKQGRPYFKVLGPQTELTEFPPLVMVDLVAINDPGKILALNPQSIDRIEIVNSLYLKGDEIYGGILNIISRKGDFAGISLPSSGVFINYEFRHSSEPDFSLAPAPDKPDARNTVLWIPDFDPVSGSDIQFTAPDTPGKYVVILRGFYENGEFMVKKSEVDVIKK